jgi:hypothetical protein
MVEENSKREAKTIEINSSQLQTIKEYLEKRINKSISSEELGINIIKPSSEQQLPKQPNYVLRIGLIGVSVLIVASLIVVSFK